MNLRKVVYFFFCETPCLSARVIHAALLSRHNWSIRERASYPLWPDNGWAEFSSVQWKMAIFAYLHIKPLPLHENEPIGEGVSKIICCDVLMQHCQCLAGTSHDMNWNKIIVLMTGLKKVTPVSNTHQKLWAAHIINNKLTYYFLRSIVSWVDQG